MKKCMLIFTIMLLVGLSVTIGSAPAQETATLALAEHGPYSVGVQTLTFVDESRGNRRLATEIWYPASVPESSSLDVLRDATPDGSGAPYPLIMYSHGFGQPRNELNVLTEHLASHGYVVVANDHRDRIAWQAVIDRPLDVLFVLDQVTSMTQEDFVGIIDGNRVGVMGWSIGALTTILTGGAQIDPEAWPSWCDDKTLPRICANISKIWGDVVDYRSQFDPPLEEGNLWPSAIDVPVQAILPMAPVGGPIFGDDGLDAVTAPVLIMAGTLDPLAVYDRDVVFTYEQMQTEDRYLLTFIGGDHGFPFTYQTPVLHFATAFFGYYLQGREEYAEYLTADYVDQINDLVWGVYEGD